MPKNMERVKDSIARRFGRKTADCLFRLSRERDGAVFAIFAIFLVILLGFGAYAIDMSYAYTTRNMLQVTASAAALAAAPELPDKSAAIDAALAYAEENMPAANHGNVLDTDDIEFGHWNVLNETYTPEGSLEDGETVNAVRVTTKRSTDNDNRLDLFLAPVLGKNSLDIATSAVAYAKIATAWDVSLVQDVTGTFLEEIGDARVADQTLLNCVSNNFVNSKMGLTIFNGTARIETPMLPVGLPDNLGNYVAMSDAIENLNSCNGDVSDPPMPPCTGTHVGIGIERAIDQLDSSEPGEGIIGEAIIIVGDGRPNARSNAQGFYPESRYYSTCGGWCSSNELAQMANLAANEASIKGYDVFVIFYDEENDDTAAAFFEGLVRGAGQFRRTPNSEELDEMMFDLCNSLIDLKLVM